jgi:hypothetical protein
MPAAPRVWQKGLILRPFWPMGSLWTALRAGLVLGSMAIRERPIFRLTMVFFWYSR